MYKNIKTGLFSFTGAGSSSPRQNIGSAQILQDYAFFGKEIGSFRKENKRHRFGNQNIGSKTLYST